jgi:hypothetical protein
MLEWNISRGWHLIVITYIFLLFVLEFLWSKCSGETAGVPKYHWRPEVGKVTLKSNGNEAFSNESFFKK